MPLQFSQETALTATAIRYPISKDRPPYASSPLNHQAPPLKHKPEKYEQHLGKSISVDDEAESLITADNFNVITERYDPSPRYDLVIVTIVLQYFNDAELLLLLALSNMESMIGSGGYLIHNESRPLMLSSIKNLNLSMLHSRTVLIASSKNQPLYDRVYIHRK